MAHWSQLGQDSAKTATEVGSHRLPFAHVATDPDYPDLTDKALLEEIDLLAELMTAASAKNEPLTDAEIDQRLGLTQHGDEDDDTPSDTSGSETPSRTDGPE
jgi:hypothetical protein